MTTTARATWGRFELYGTMHPAKHVGGDFFDFFPLNSKHLAFTIADVAGKGVPAALFMTRARGLIRALGQKARSPLHCFQQLNELITFENESSMFITAFYGILDAETGCIEYCNAGHNPPYLINDAGDLEQVGRAEGVALGASKDNSYFVQHAIQLKKKDTFFLYTDGVTEAMDTKQQLFQESRLEDILKANYTLPLKELFAKILTEVQSFSGDTEQSDDITLLAFRMM